MPNYLDLIEKRIAGENQGPATAVAILIDHEQHLPLRKAWEEARTVREAAEQHLAGVQAAHAAGEGGKRRMNQASPLTQARDALAQAVEAEEQALAAVRACFLTAHFSAPVPAVAAQITAKSGGDLDAMYDTTTRLCLVKVTDHEGNPVPEITGDILAAYLKHAPAGERAKVIRALDDTVAAVDYPT